MMTTPSKTLLEPLKNPSETASETPSETPSETLLGSGGSVAGNESCEYRDTFQKYRGRGSIRLS